ncbi:hypothetical protein EJ04DRAFT_307878 [Polyplosphaeria fusca]|uniref:Uncharacterized protein n=1 Tax=Polyplosphaeria fusca TaxID=682080 RepID=A0A9P4QX44_9PLEO|nr:hypothetical protein EJ04DRAFT_307878 [Polyplosphaeria fusca]
MASIQLQPCGVHLVGSVNLPTTEDVLDRIPPLLSNRLRRLPDGETGKRDHFTAWQRGVFAAAPEAIKRRDPNDQSEIEVPNVTHEQLAMTLAKLPKQLKTQYEDYALDSYALFETRKASGQIPSHTKFQVALPGLVNVVSVLAAPYKLAIEPHYEEAMARSLQRIQDQIRHDELAIQIDVAIEFSFLEGSSYALPYFNPVFPGIIDRLSRFANLVADDVELGFHLCYGDLGHKHFIEPKDTALMVEVANALKKAIRHPIQWIHMPVPIERKDVAYFEPLKNLEFCVPELYLGLVHAHDEGGTRERIAAAQEVVKEFGVATECGMGRTPKEHFATIMEILNSVSSPIV